MRLTTIKLAGFKSFVDPTVLSLSSNLTSVVGPNGCGKSNVIDAVRWVTGESNARQLRGEALEDVIFNGSKARKPVGRASVELRFDNSDATLAGQYGAFAEISVKRELSRDGASRYFINNGRARRRDVVDLFLGTGLGGRSNYAVIEQGAVNRLIEAKPEDMRQVLEEAAGISRYKERRRETENRIRHTRDNLDRLNDLIGEVAQRLTVLKRQAANAEKYKTFKAEERQLRAALLALRWQAQTAAVDAARARQAEAEDVLRSTVSARRAALEARDADNAGQQDALAQMQTHQTAFYDAQARVGRIEQALAHAREVAAIRRREREEMAARATALATRAHDEQAQHEALTRDKSAVVPALEAAQATLAQAREAQSASEQSTAQAETAWDAHNAVQSNPVQQLEAERTKARYGEQQLAQLKKRDTARREERAGLAAPDDDALAAAERALGDDESQLQADQNASREAGREDEALALRIGKAEREVDGLRAGLGEQLAELAGEKKLQQAVLREDDATVTAWLAAQERASATGVARRVRVDKPWRTAAEAALGAVLRGFLVDTLPTRLSGDWPGESLTLIEDVAVAGQAGRATAEPAGLPCLADGLDAPAPIVSAAARWFVAETTGQALACRQSLTADQAIVTLDGCRVTRTGLITPAATATESGVLEREQRIKTLADQAAAQQTRLDQSLATLEDDRSARRAIRERRQQLDKRIGEQRRQLEGDRARLQGERIRAEQLSRRRQEIGNELDILAGELADVAHQRTQADERITVLEDEAQAFAAARGAARTALDDARNRRNRARAEAAAAERDLRDTDAQLTQIDSRLESLALRRKDTGAAWSEINDRLASFDAEHSESDADDSVDAAELDAAREAQALAQRALRVAREALQAREQAQQQRAQALMQAEQNVEAAREALQQIRIEVESADVRSQAVVEQLDELGHAMPAVVAGLAEDDTIERTGEQIEAVERRIARLGAINLAAIEEYDEEAARESYLSDQHADLAQALATLEEAIAKIDRETRQRFKATYEQVNTRFAEMFPDLFGGGEAALELTEDDWLNTGVRVMARPPGKRNASIQMLSGGEKALTAVALLFALFELNPAPFCMLDEIDAPLDDANVARFCELVRRMSARVQFIVITHNKLTMELAEQLHGVTMAEPGVSRLVSVDIDQALDMAG